MMSKPNLVEFKSDSKSYSIHCNWEQRAETPEELAARFLRMIDSLKEIDPAFRLWTCGKKRPEKLEEVRDRYAEEIAAGITRDDWREPVPGDGYRFGARSRDTPKDRSFYVTCMGGSIIKRSFTNSVTLATDSVTGSRPDAGVVSYRVFRPALLAIVDAWEPVRARATCHPLIQLYKGDSLFPPVWIQYLCPWLAQKITPPSTVLSENLPNGGLLMSATTETFDVDNPAHLAAAQDMATAMAPLDRLPWPSQK